MAPVETKRHKRNTRQRNRRAVDVVAKDRTKDAPTAPQNPESIQAWRKRVYVKKKKVSGKGVLAGLRAMMAKAAGQWW